MTEPNLEIERTYLLRGLPPLPEGATSVCIEQGYLPDRNALPEGRLRRTTHQDGRIEHTHTIKHGSGLIRAETERAISAEEFASRWPETIGQRLSKTRFFVRDSGFVWEIDQFDDLDLTLAEVELHEASTTVQPPEWLAPYIVREVTEEKQFQNYELALLLAREQHRK